jgi:hypothetical protein
VLLKSLAGLRKKDMVLVALKQLRSDLFFKQPNPNT